MFISLILSLLMMAISQLQALAEDVMALPVKSPAVNEAPAKPAESVASEMVPAAKPETPEAVTFDKPEAPVNDSAEPAAVVADPTPVAPAKKAEKPAPSYGPVKIQKVDFSQAVKAPSVTGSAATPTESKSVEPLVTPVAVP
jgi:hypothetical protein